MKPSTVTPHLLQVHTELLYIWVTRNVGGAAVMVAIKPSNSRPNADQWRMARFFDKTLIEMMLTFVPMPKSASEVKYPRYSVKPQRISNSLSMSALHHWRWLSLSDVGSPCRTLALYGVYWQYYPTSSHVRAFYWSYGCNVLRSRLTP